MSNVPPRPPHDPNQAWPPQDPYGAPPQYGQYAAPPQYGAPPPYEQYGQYGQYGAQPYGYGAPPQGGYPGGQPMGYPGGYPPPGWGPVPPQRSGGSGKWWLIGGIGAAVVIALVVVVAILAGGGGGGGGTDSAQGGSSSTSDDEAAIRQLFEDVDASGDADFDTALQRYFCAEDRRLLEGFGDLGDADVPGGSTPSQSQAEISDIEVDGNTATATVDTGSRSETVHFRKEGGEWKVCMSADPGLTPPR